MVFPLVPLALTGLGVSGLANVYRGYVHGNAYRQFASGYKALDTGYRNYLARHGRKINPNRALTSYYGNYIRNTAQAKTAYMGAVGSAAGTFGAGSMITSHWL